MSTDQKKALKTNFRLIHKYLLSIVLCSIGFFFIINRISQPTITSTHDLAAVKGTISNYSFIYEGQGRTLSKKFYIWTKEHSCTFQIVHMSVPYFELLNFEKDIRKGDSLKFSIPKSDLDNLMFVEKIPVYSIDNNLHNYLKQQSTIAEYNRNIEIPMGVFFTFIGIISYFLIKKRIIKPY